MPIYEYSCLQCGHKLEAIQKISDAPLKKCPECGRNKLKKLVSSASFQLKGTGWYVTDFRDKGGTKEKKPKLDEIKDNATTPTTTTPASASPETPKKESGKKEKKE